MANNAINWESNPSLTSYLTTELNSLADGGNDLGGAIDNSSGLDMYMDLELSLAEQGSARDSGAYVAIYLIPSADGGSTYAYGGDSLDPGANHLVATIPFDAAVTARDQLATMIPVPPGHFKLLVMNETGQAFAGTGNTLSYRLYSAELQ